MYSLNSLKLRHSLATFALRKKKKKTLAAVRKKRNIVDNSDIYFLLNT